jgi:putative acetyltransferase
VGPRDKETGQPFVEKLTLPRGEMREGSHRAILGESAFSTWRDIVTKRCGNHPVATREYVGVVPITITAESPLSDDVRALIAGLNAHLTPLSPAEFQFQMTVEEMNEPDTIVFVARDETQHAVGCGALKVHSDDLGEVKRMFTMPEVRGRRVGSHILEAIIEQARGAGLPTLMLETGAGPGFAPAWRLYERNGFRRRGPFLDYPDSEWSAYFELALT